MIYSAAFKVCIFGDPGVGKTSLTYRYITNRFIQDAKKTIGVDIVAKDVKINNYKVKLQIWDFGGDERFKIFFPTFARGSSGGIFMYDITRKSSLDKIEEWLNIFKKNLTKEESQIIILGVGGKKDLDYNREITLENAENLALKHNIFEIIECSAKTGENVEKIFESITYKMLMNSGLI